ncbi:Ff.00g097090.m01.CDS01 [Fusarium sp. VM40]|nr:Ff.00g097090.m01.CDS01 [Fusarium sp. VM40]
MDNHHRPSTSSDAASILSGSTVFSKETPTQLSPPKTDAIDAVKQRKSMRQRVRNVVADLGRPPTARDDEESGMATQSRIDVGPAPGTVLMGSATV